jgi:hypothetical protein
VKALKKMDLMESRRKTKKMKKRDWPSWLHSRNSNRSRKRLKEGRKKKKGNVEKLNRRLPTKPRRKLSLKLTGKDAFVSKSKSMISLGKPILKMKMPYRS